MLEVLVLARDVARALGAAPSLKSRQELVSARDSRNGDTGQTV